MLNAMRSRSPQTRLLAGDRLDRKRAHAATETESSAGRTRPVRTAWQSAFVADKEAVKQQSQWWGPVIKDSCGALPGTPVHGVQAAISAWTEGLCGETPEKELSPEDGQKYALLVRAAPQGEIWNL